MDELLHDKRRFFIPKIRMLPMVEHCQNGFHFRRYVICNAIQGMETHLFSNRALHLRLNEERIDLLDETNNTILLYGVGGIKNFRFRTDVYSSERDEAIAVLNSSFTVSTISYFTQPSITLLGNWNKDSCMISYKSKNLAEVGLGSTGPTVTMMAFDKLTLIQQHLLIMFILKVIAGKYANTLGNTAIPIGYLGWISRQLAVEHSYTANTLKYLLAKLTSVTVVLTNYSDYKLKILHVLLPNRKILFTCEVNSTGDINAYDQEANLSVNDNFGVRFFQAEGFLMSKDMKVFQSGDQLLGVAEKYTGNFLANGKRPDSFLSIPTGNRVLEVRHSIITGTAYMAQTCQSVGCNIYSHIQKDLKVADICMESDRVKVAISPTANIPLEWKTLILIYTIKLVNSYYNIKYKGEVCTPHIGYIR